MTKHKPYKDRDHSVAKEALDRLRLIRAKRKGVKTNVGDPNDKGLTGSKPSRGKKK